MNIKLKKEKKLRKRTYCKKGDRPTQNKIPPENVALYKRTCNSLKITQRGIQQENKRHRGR